MSVYGMFSPEGQLSAQRVVRQVKREKNASESVASFTEELVVRRELADNFCFYNHKYDDVSGECCSVTQISRLSWPLFKCFSAQVRTIGRRRLCRSTLRTAGSTFTQKSSWRTARPTIRCGTPLR